MNKIILTGRLVNAPVVQNIGSAGTACVKNTLAVDRPGKKGEADFVPITIWGKTAEYVANYATKGARLSLVGSWRSGSYEKEGKKFYTHEVSVETVEIIDYKKREVGEQAEPTSEDVVLEGSNTLPF